MAKLSTGNDNRPNDGSLEQLRTDLTEAIRRAQNTGLKPLTIWRVIDDMGDELDLIVWGDNA